MIYVTQGHERGIGLEIFLKSFLLLSKQEKTQITLVVKEQDLNTNFTDLKFSKKNFNDLKIIYTKDDRTPSSTSSLTHTLGIIKPSDILVTLPTSKDQLIFNNTNMAGYTEFFRTFYKNSNIAMTFRGTTQNVLLITDHIALKDVPAKITKSLIIEKTKTTIEFYKKYFSTFQEIIFAGINPHVGENGILGKEDHVISEAITDLKKEFKAIKFLGPYSGDTLHMHENSDRAQLLVYMYHDQGLAKFKANYGLIGLNISMGLPFLRLSVDHGTAFELYGKNKANISGMMFLFKQAFEVSKYVDKRN